MICASLARSGGGGGTVEGGVGQVGPGQVHAGQVADRVVVLGIAEPACQHDARIAGGSLGLRAVSLSTLDGGRIEL